ncbi:DUF2924 domain-containing protein [Sphingomonas endolithica]|uniref:DUF2924 domain-containing protein n=1 Tax=Sphingomonas endolithica TaxID=2972485 RepID=UPI0021AFF0D5|nr:DUF2924 domain-containing protein [Sphingomonas sp. ZFBP2030]
MAKLDDDLAALAILSSAQLQDRWKAVTGTLAPRISASFLRMALGYEMQAKALGGAVSLMRTALHTLDIAL